MSQNVQNTIPPKYCPSCGTQNAGNAKFCRACGFNFVTMSGGQPQEMHPARPQQPVQRPVQQPAPQNLPPQGPNPSGIPLFAKILIPVLAVLVIILAVLVIRSRKPGPASPVQTAEGQTSDAQNGPGSGTALPAGTQDAEQAGSTNADGEVIPGTATALVPDASGAMTTVHVEALARPSFFAAIATSTASRDTSAAVPSYSIAPDCSNLDNIDRLYLSQTEKNLLTQYGFFVAERGGGDEFYEIYEMNRYDQRPSFVTTDSMMHTYHLYFSYLMKNTERDYLYASLKQTADAMLAKSYEQLNALKGTEWETAAKINTAFFGVGASLLDPAVQVPQEVQDLVSAEVSLIQAHQGIGESPILNSFESDASNFEDYSQYIVRGYYEGDERLERYFRAMMWFGRMNFTQSEETLDRAALLMTMALDDTTRPTWEAIYSVTSFFAGASDDSGYYEYKPIIDAAYGEGATVQDLPGNENGWTAYHTLTAAMAPPKINSVAVIDDGSGADRTAQNKGYRFMGQRFSVDAAIFENLLYNKVGANSAGENRMLPNALDIPAALGSDTALGLLDSAGETAYAGYKENMEALRAEIADSPEDLWTASLYSKWLDTLRPLLIAKGSGYPAFMQTDQWNRKDLQTFLGSYAELKHDTVLYSKQVMVEMGGDNFGTYDDRGYVEPEPEVFGRLAALTKATIEGLNSYGLLGAEDADNLSRLEQLADQLRVIAEKELRNERPSDAEFDLIRTFGGQLEHFWQEVYKNETDKTYFSGRDFPAAVITDVATDPNGQVLEIGTGDIGSIYVVVPVDGSIRVAVGAVYSFYQFAHPMNDRLTDTKWRVMMGIEMNDAGSYNTPAMRTEEWTRDFQKTWDELQ